MRDKGYKPTVVSPHGYPVLTAIRYLSPLVTVVQILVKRDVIMAEFSTKESILIIARRLHRKKAVDVLLTGGLNNHLIFGL